MRHFPRRIWDDQSGATAIEYSLIVAVVLLAIISAVGEFGGSLNNVFVSVSSDLRRSADCGGGPAPDFGTGTGDGNCANNGNGEDNTGGSGPGTGNGGGTAGGGAGAGNGGGLGAEGTL